MLVQLCEYTKHTELCTSSGSIIWDMNYLNKGVFKKEEGITSKILYEQNYFPKVEFNSFLCILINKIKA